MQVEDRGVNVLNHPLEVIHRLRRPLLHFRRAHPRDGALQRQSDGEEALDHTVVQIAGDAVAIGQQSSRTSGAGSPRAAGQCGLVGEGGHHVELFVAERIGPRAAQYHDDTGDGVGGAQRQHQRRARSADQPAVDVEGVQPLRGALQKRPTDRGAGHRHRLCGRRIGHAGAGQVGDRRFGDFRIRRLRVGGHDDQDEVRAGERDRLLGDEPKYRAVGRCSASCNTW